MDNKLDKTLGSKVHKFAELARVNSRQIKKWMHSSIKVRHLDRCIFIQCTATRCTTFDTLWRANRLSYPARGKRSSNETTIFLVARRTGSSLLWNLSQEGGVNRLEKRGRSIVRIGESNRPRRHEDRAGGRVGGTRIFSPGSRKSDYEESSSRVINSRWKSTLGKIPTFPRRPSKDRRGSAAIGWPAAAPATVEFIYLLNAPSMNPASRRVASFVRKPVCEWKTRRSAEGKMENMGERGAKRGWWKKVWRSHSNDEEGGRERQRVEQCEKERERGRVWNWREKGG